MAIAEQPSTLGGEQLQPLDTATTVRVQNGETLTTDGPFAETKELVAGFWLWRVGSVDEAVAWLKKAPFGGGTEVELRPVFEAADFVDALAPELREREERLRARTGGRTA